MTLKEKYEALMAVGTNYYAEIGKELINNII